MVKMFRKVVFKLGEMTVGLIIEIHSNISNIWFVLCCRIIRAFLIEEQKIVVKVLRAQAAAGKAK